MNSPGYRDMVPIDYVRPIAPSYSLMSAARFKELKAMGPDMGTYDPNDLPSSKNKKLDITAMNKGARDSYIARLIKAKKDLPGIGTYDLNAINKGYAMTSRGSGGRRR